MNIVADWSWVLFDAAGVLWVITWILGTRWMNKHYDQLMEQYKALHEHYEQLVRDAREGK
jgi:hypothetical protein